ncbi:hypothetical protein ISN76_10230 [Dyella halodurans]|uniref:Uncharacterized protein n=1 Tax=Dyella halodurans TaxID=1920171 RepID=A0ABV9C2X6_9GAMM|nr:hypothetical protein [Dyella halodurans]
MPIVALLADLGLISEGVAAVIGANASCYGLLHAWRLLRAAISSHRA